MFRQEATSLKSWLTFWRLHLPGCTKRKDSNKRSATHKHKDQFLKQAMQQIQLCMRCSDRVGCCALKGYLVLIHDRVAGALFPPQSVLVSLPTGSWDRAHSSATRSLPQPPSPEGRSPLRVPGRSGSADTALPRKPTSMCCLSCPGLTLAGHISKQQDNAMSCVSA